MRHDTADFSPLNPRLIGVLASALWLAWSRNIIGCLALGMAAYSLARLFLAWACLVSRRVDR